MASLHDDFLACNDGTTDPWLDRVVQRDYTLVINQYVSRPINAPPVQVTGRVCTFAYSFCLQVTFEGVICLEQIIEGKMLSFSRGASKNQAQSAHSSEEGPGGTR